MYEYIYMKIYTHHLTSHMHRLCACFIYFTAINDRDIIWLYVILLSQQIDVTQVDVWWNCRFVVKQICYNMNWLS